MQQIRYTQRICTDQQKIDAFLRRMRTGVLGICAGAYPYAVPVNFIWNDGAVYFHGMGSGKKFDLLLESPPVCFTVYGEVGVFRIQPAEITAKENQAPPENLFANSHPGR
ncbi:MAG: pyridoxamine 5'-phosphate oxidase family protein [Intestinibacillus sp.]